MADIPDDLAARLRHWAAGLPGIEPAVQLLTSTRWLADPAFVGECIVVVDDSLAIVDWSGVGAFLADHAERTGDPDSVRALDHVHRLARQAWETVDDDPPPR